MNFQPVNQILLNPHVNMALHFLDVDQFKQSLPEKYRVQNGFQLYLEKMSHLCQTMAIYTSMSKTIAQVPQNFQMRAQQELAAQNAKLQVAFNEFMPGATQNNRIREAVFPNNRNDQFRLLVGHAAFLQQQWNIPNVWEQVFRAEPVAEPPVEPVAEIPVEPVAHHPVKPEDTKAIMEPVLPVEPFSEPLVEPVLLAEPVAEPPVEPVAEFIVEPIAEPPVEPEHVETIVESVLPIEPVAEPPVEPVHVEIIVEPVLPIEPIAEPLVEPIAEPPVEPEHAEAIVEPLMLAEPAVLVAEPPVEPKHAKSKKKLKRSRNLMAIAKEFAPVFDVLDEDDDDYAIRRPILRSQKRLREMAENQEEVLKAIKEEPLDE